MTGLDPRRRWRRLQRQFPLAGVWLVALCAAVVLWMRQDPGHMVTGYADATTHRVAARSAGRLREVAIVADQAVRQGQIVGWLDDADLQLELTAARYELLRLRRQGESDAVGRGLDTDRLASDREADLLRFAQDVEAAHVDELTQRAELAAARVELQGLESILARTRRLGREGLLSPEQLEADSVACQAQRERVAGLAATQAVLQQRHAEARARFAAFAALDDAGGAAALLAAVDAAAAVQEARIEQVELQLAGCALRAPIDGRIGEVLFRAGEVVAAGECVATVVAPQTADVVAYVPEERALDLAAGDRVTLRRRHGGGGTLHGVVASVAAAVTPLPVRLDPQAALPGWGRAVRVRLEDGPVARPGEAFAVRF